MNQVLILPRERGTGRRSLEIFLPDWLIQGGGFLLAVGLAFTLLLNITNHLEANRSGRYRPIEHSNPLE
jgi:hypothetical protein